MVEEGDKDMGKTRTVEESIRGKERENVRVAKKDRKKVTIEGDGRGGGGVERVRMGWGRGAVPRRPSFPIAFFYYYGGIESSVRRSYPCWANVWIFHWHHG